MRTGALLYQLGSLPQVVAAKVTEADTNRYRRENNLDFDDISTDNWIHNTLDVKMLEIVKSSPELKAAKWYMTIEEVN